MAPIPNARTVAQLTQVDFASDSQRRFGSLDDYLNEKARDKFSMEGNKLAARRFLDAHLGLQYAILFLETIKGEVEKGHMTEGTFIDAITLLSAPDLLRTEPKKRQRFYNKGFAATKEIGFYDVTPGLFFGQTTPELDTAMDKYLNFVRGYRLFDMVSMSRILFHDVAKSQQLFDKVNEVYAVYLSSLKERGIRIADVGPAIGAISTWFALSLLKRYEIPGTKETLADYAQLTLVDVSPEVLDKNVRGKFTFDRQHINQYKLPGIGWFKERLASAEQSIVDISQQGFAQGDTDILLACYLLHHISGPQQKAALANLRTALRPGQGNLGGYMGIAEEWFGLDATGSNTRYLFHELHEGDDVAPAHESLIAPLDLTRMMAETGLKLFLSLSRAPQRYIGSTGTQADRARIRRSVLPLCYHAASCYPPPIKVGNGGGSPIGTAPHYRY